MPSGGSERAGSRLLASSVEFKVRIKEARNLKAYNGGTGPVNSIAAFRFPNQARNIVETHTVFNNPNPAWNFERSVKILKTEDGVDRLCGSPFTVFLRASDASERPSSRTNNASGGDDNASGGSLPSAFDVNLQEPSVGNLLGTIKIDMLPFIHGATSVADWFPVIAPPLRERRSQSPTPVADAGPPPKSAGKPDSKAATGEIKAKASATGTVTAQAAAAAATLAAEEEAKEDFNRSSQSSPVPAASEVFIELSLDAPLLSPKEISDLVIMTINVNGLKSLPEKWIDEGLAFEDAEEQQRQEGRIFGLIKGTARSASRNASFLNRAGGAKGAPPPKDASKAGGKEPPKAAAAPAKGAAPAPAAGAKGGVQGSGSTASLVVDSVGGSKHRVGPSPAAIQGDALFKLQYQLGYEMPFTSTTTLPVRHTAGRLTAPPGGYSRPSSQQTWYCNRGSRPSSKLANGREPVPPPPGAKGKPVAAPAAVVEVADGDALSEEERDALAAKEALLLHAEKMKRYVNWEGVRHVFLSRTAAAAYLDALRAGKMSSMKIDIGREVLMQLPLSNDADAEDPAIDPELLAQAEEIKRYRGVCELDMMTLVRPDSKSVSANLKVKLDPVAKVELEKLMMSTAMIKAQEEANAAADASQSLEAVATGQASMEGTLDLDADGGAQGRGAKTPVPREVVDLFQKYDTSVTVEVHLSQALLQSTANKKKYDIDEVVPPRVAPEADWPKLEEELVQEVRLMLDRVMDMYAHPDLDAQMSAQMVPKHLMMSKTVTRGMGSAKATAMVVCDPTNDLTVPILGDSGSGGGRQGQNQGQGAEKALKLGDIERAVSYMLNKTGAYHAFKEKLKPAVVRMTKGVLKEAPAEWGVGFDAKNDGAWAPSTPGSMDRADRSKLTSMGAYDRSVKFSDQFTQQQGALGGHANAHSTTAAQQNENISNWQFADQDSFRTNQPSSSSFARTGFADSLHSAGVYSFTRVNERVVSYVHERLLKLVRVAAASVFAENGRPPQALKPLNAYVDRVVTTVNNANRRSSDRGGYNPNTRRKAKERNLKELGVRLPSRGSTSAASETASTKAAVTREEGDLLPKKYQLGPSGVAAAAISTAALEELSAKELRILAEEADLLGDYEAACRYHHRRVAILSSPLERHDARVQANPAMEGLSANPDHWYDYALCCLKYGDSEQGVFCLQQALSIRNKHIPSLTALSALYIERKDLRNAETVIRHLTQVLARTDTVSRDSTYSDAASDEAGLARLDGSRESMKKRFRDIFLSRVIEGIFFDKAVLTFDANESYDMAARNYLLYLSPVAIPGIEGGSKRRGGGHGGGGGDEIRAGKTTMEELAVMMNGASSRPTTADVQNLSRPITVPTNNNNMTNANINNNNLYTNIPASVVAQALTEKGVLGKNSSYSFLFVSMLLDAVDVLTALRLSNTAEGLYDMAASLIAAYKQCTEGVITKGQFPEYSRVASRLSNKAAMQGMALNDTGSQGSGHQTRRELVTGQVLAASAAVSGGGATGMGAGVASGAVTGAMSTGQSAAGGSRPQTSGTSSVKNPLPGGVLGVQFDVDIPFEDIQDLENKAGASNGRLRLMLRQSDTALTLLRDALVQSGATIEAEWLPYLPGLTPQVVAARQQKRFEVFYKVDALLAKAATAAAGGGAAGADAAESKGEGGASASAGAGSDIQSASQSVGGSGGKKKDKDELQTIPVPQPQVFLPILADIGHLYYDQKKYAACLVFYQAYLSWDAEGEASANLILYRTAQILSLMAGKEEETKKAYMRFAKTMPCATAFLGVGTAFMRAGNITVAARAFGEATKYDRCNPTLWAHICLFNLEKQRPVPGMQPVFPLVDLVSGLPRDQVLSKRVFQLAEATKAFSNALKLGLKDAGLLLAIGEGFAHKGDFIAARTALVRSLEAFDTARARVALGDVCGATNLYEQQRVHYARAFEIKQHQQQQSGTGSGGEEEEEVESGAIQSPRDTYMQWSVDDLRRIVVEE